MSYEGWKNWETWNVALWCDNDQGIYRDRMNVKPRTAGEVHDFVQSYFPRGTPDMQDQDPFEPREEVDWQEIADHWSEEYTEEEVE
jgi:hypothetical protein